MITFVPRSDRSAKSRPFRSGRTTSGSWALTSACRPDSGPSAHSPRASSPTSPIRSRSASAADVERRRQRHAHLAAARALGLDRPPGAPFELGRRLVEALDDHPGDPTRCQARRGTPVPMRSSRSSSGVGRQPRDQRLSPGSSTDDVSRPGTGRGQSLLNRAGDTLDRLGHPLRAGDRLAESLDVLCVQLAVLGRQRRDGVVKVGVGPAPHVGVGLGGLDQHNADAPRREFHPQRVGHPLERELRGVVRARSSGSRRGPLIDETNTILPLEARNRGRTAWVTAACPTTLTSSWRRSSEAGSPRSGLRQRRPRC